MHWYHWLAATLGTGVMGWVMFIFKDTLTGAAQAVGGWFVDKLKKKDKTSGLPNNGNGYLKHVDFEKYMLNMATKVDLDRVEERIHNTLIENVQSLKRDYETSDNRKWERLDSFMDTVMGLVAIKKVEIKNQQEDQHVKGN